MTIAVQSFGAEYEYKRMIFSLYSFIAQSGITDITICVFTDNVAYFDGKFEGLKVKYFELTESKINQMRGQIDFVHRMKIAVIEEALLTSTDKLLYFDSDTFFVANPALLFEQISLSEAVMHEFEYAFSSLADRALPAGETFQNFFKKIVNQTFSLSQSSITVTPECRSYNAGVIGLHQSHLKFIPDVYALTNEFFVRSRNHASEQFAFSVILQRNVKITTSERVVYHYWYRIKKKIMDQLLESRLNKSFFSLPMETRQQQVRSWLPQLSKILESHLLTIQDNAIQSFHINDFRSGFIFALKAFVRKPLDFVFLRHVMYHTRRFVLRRNH